eukprot:scaffold186504_cov28-Tisochrysis_lutea.AAC.6
MSAVAGLIAPVARRKKSRRAQQTVQSACCWCGGGSGSGDVSTRAGVTPPPAPSGEARSSHES